MDRDTYNNTAQRNATNQFNKMKSSKHLCAMRCSQTVPHTHKYIVCTQTVFSTSSNRNDDDNKMGLTGIVYSSYKKQSNTSVAINYVSDSHGHVIQSIYTIYGCNRTRKLFHNYCGNSFSAANRNENDERKNWRSRAAEGLQSR